MKKLFHDGVFVRTEGDPNLTAQVFVHSTQASPEAVALAQVFSAGPEMLAAMHALLDRIHALPPEVWAAAGGGDDDWERADARKAIGKARGWTPDHLAQLDAIEKAGG